MSIYRKYWWKSEFHEKTQTHPNPHSITAYANLFVCNIRKDSKPTMLTPNYCKAKFKLFPVIPTMYFPRL